jgi:hypothetical protein
MSKVSVYKDGHGTYSVYVGQKKVAYFYTKSKADARARKERAKQPKAKRKNPSTGWKQEPYGEVYSYQKNVTVGGAKIRALLHPETARGWVWIVWERKDDTWSKWKKVGNGRETGPNGFRNAKAAADEQISEMREIYGGYTPRRKNARGIPSVKEWLVTLDNGGKFRVLAPTKTLAKMNFRDVHYLWGHSIKSVAVSRKPVGQRERVKPDNAKAHGMWTGWRNNPVVKNHKGYKIQVKWDADRRAWFGAITSPRGKRPTVRSYGAGMGEAWRKAIKWVDDHAKKSARKKAPKRKARTRRKNPAGPSSFLKKEYGAKPTEDFADYLRYVAADMRSSGTIEGAREHGKMAGVIRRLAKTRKPTANDLSYASWLRNIYGPDLDESGKEMTAEDVFHTVWLIGTVAKRGNPGTMTLTPAYGRDYKSKAAVQKDWDSGKDFIVNQFGNRYDGKPMNKQDAKAAGMSSVMIRFHNLTKIYSFKV